MPNITINVHGPIYICHEQLPELLNSVCAKAATPESSDGNSSPQSLQHPLSQSTLESMSLEQLRDICTEQGVKFDKRMKSQGLIKAYMAHMDAESSVIKRTEASAQAEAVVAQSEATGPQDANIEVVSPDQPLLPGDHRAAQADSFAAATSEETMPTDASPDKLRSWLTNVLAFKPRNTWTSQEQTAWAMFMQNQPAPAPQPQPGDQGIPTDLPWPE